MSVQRKHIGENGKLLLPIFTDKTVMLDYLGENLADIQAEKSTAFKLADAFGYGIASGSGYSSKATSVNPDITNEILVKAVINATNLLDTHKDVHIPGIWKKGLSENPPKWHLQEHQMKFSNRISKDIKAYTEVVSFKSLGYPRYKGDTEILVFDSKIKKSVNAEMFKLYATGEIDNHSVGMQYVKMMFCVNSDSREWKEEYDNYLKYKEEIANQKDLGEFYWAQLEAKAIEGSAVLGGSCWTTPTMSVESIKDNQPPNGTEENKNEPLNSTRKNLFHY